MKIYRNASGKTYLEGRVLTHRIDEGRVFSGRPTEEQLAAWGYEEVSQPSPTDEEAAAQARLQRMDEIQQELAATDYLALKAFEGEDMSEHEGWKERRAALRKEYRELEGR